MKLNETSLAFDFYRPARAAPGKRFPVLVFFNGFGGTWQRDSPQYQGWARVATAHGFAAVNADAGAGRVAKDFDALVTYLKDHAEELQVDAERIAVMAWSGNVGEGLPLVEDAGRNAIKAAVFYYGAAEVTAFDLTCQFSSFARAWTNLTPIGRLTKWWRLDWPPTLRGPC